MAKVMLTFMYLSPYCPVDLRWFQPNTIMVYIRTVRTVATVYGQVFPILLAKTKAKLNKIIAGLP